MPLTPLNGISTKFCEKRRIITVAKAACIVDARAFLPLWVRRSASAFQSIQRGFGRQLRESVTIVASVSRLKGFSRMCAASISTPATLSDTRRAESDDVRTTWWLREKAASGGARSPGPACSRPASMIAVSGPACRQTNAPTGSEASKSNVAGTCEPLGDCPTHQAVCVGDKDRR